MKKILSFKPAEVAFSKAERESKTVPDQSMSIREIVRRFVKGIPVGVYERNPVYCDQNDHDLEQLSRMDFGEKAAYAADLAAQASALESELKELQASENERKATAAKEAEAVWAAKVRAAAKGSEEPAKGSKEP